MTGGNAEERNRGRKSFWATLPGILTGLTTLVVAITGLIALFISQPQSPSGPPPSPPPAPPVATTPFPPPAPPSHLPGHTLDPIYEVFQLFGESVKIVYIAKRKGDAEAIERQLRKMRAKVSTKEAWSVPERFKNRIISKSSKQNVATTVKKVTKDIAQLDVLVSLDKRDDEIVIWLGQP